MYKPRLQKRLYVLRGNAVEVRGLVPRLPVVLRVVPPAAPAPPLELPARLCCCAKEPLAVAGGAPNARRNPGRAPPAPVVALVPPLVFAFVEAPLPA